MVKNEQLKGGCVVSARTGKCPGRGEMFSLCIQAENNRKYALTDNQPVSNLQTP